MTLVDLLCLCTAAVFFCGEGVEFALDSSTLLDQRFLDGGGTGAFLLGGDDLAVEGSQLVGLVLEPTGSVLVAHRQLIGAGADVCYLLSQLLLHRAELEGAGMSIATGRGFENTAFSYHAVTTDNHRVRQLISELAGTVEIVAA